MIAENNSEVKLVKYFKEEKLNFLHFRQNLTMMRIQAQTQTMRMEGSWMTGGPYQQAERIQVMPLPAMIPRMMAVRQTLLGPGNR